MEQENQIRAKLRVSPSRSKKQVIISSSKILQSQSICPQVRENADKKDLFQAKKSKTLEALQMYSELLSEQSSLSGSVSSNNGLDALHLQPSYVNGLSAELKSLDQYLVDMLVDDVKIGLAIFKKKTHHQERKLHFKCSLLWNNIIF